MSKYFLPFQIFKHVEFELFNYSVTLQRCEEYDEATRYSYSGSLVLQPSRKVSDPTGNKVVRLMVPSVNVFHDRQVICTINTALIMLGGIYTEIFNVYYKEGLGRNQTMRQLNISRSGFYRYRNRLVYQIAVCLGWWNPD